MTQRAKFRTWMLACASILPACHSSSTAPVDPDGPQALDPPDSYTARHRLTVLPNGIGTYLEVAPNGSSAQIQLGILAGSLFVAPGLAELAARVLVESSDPASGRASLRSRIEALGGTIEASTGLMTTWFDIRVRPDSTQQAIEALRAALETPTRSRTQIQRMAEQLIAERTRDTLEEPIRVAARSLLQAEAGSDAYISALIDLDPSEVPLFHARLYRPERSLLAVRMPRTIPEMVELATKPPESSLSRWVSKVALPGEAQVLPRQFEPGLYWADTQARDNRVAFLLRLPDATMLGASEWLTMHACLTLDGTGGRLEQLQRESGLGHIQWQSEIVRLPDVTALLLTTTATSEEAVQLWRLLQRARESLVEVPPTTSELQLARQRARLTASLLAFSDSARLRQAMSLRTRSLPLDVFETRFAEMEDPNKWDPRKAAAEYQKSQAWTVVIGKPPAEPIAELIPFRVFPDGFDPKSRNEATDYNLASADVWLARARGAVGGQGAFEQMIGFTSNATTTAENTPSTTDRIAWLQDGNLSRTRTFLGQTIVTEVTADQGFESIGDERKELPTEAATELRHRMMRHPIMLLLAHATGTMRFKPVTQRKVGDRELMVLQAVGDEFDRLRIHIDIESNLIRTVESWERLADETYVHVRESWSEYRQAGAVRVPTRRITDWDDGARRSETTFADWAATRAR